MDILTQKQNSLNFLNFSNDNVVNDNNLNVINDKNKCDSGKFLGSYNAKITRYTKRDFWGIDNQGEEYLDTFDVVEILEMEEKDMITNSTSKKTALKNTCTDEEKIKENQSLNSMRSKTKVRKLITENGLGYHICTTYAKEEENRNNQIIDNKNFIKRLSYQLNKKILYVAVPEIQPKRFKNTGSKVYHMHIALPFRIEIRVLWSAWNNKRCKTCPLYTDKKKNFKCNDCQYFRGVVFIKRAGEFDLIKNANYFGKYFSKGFEEKDLNQRKFGQKRYFCSTGLNYPSEELINIPADKMQEIKQWAKDKSTFTWQKDFENNNCRDVKSFSRLRGSIFDAVMTDKFK